jgi:c-di-GMP-binding flagellar brake protein YcgR
VRSSRISGSDQDQKTQDFLSKLFDFRKKIEMEKPRMKNGITSSRQLGELQHLSINVEDQGVFKSKIFGNMSQYLVISKPEKEGADPFFPWAGQKISVYFWREDDAGYVFDTGVLEEVQYKGDAALRIAHSETLFRTQKRKSIRVKLHRAAFIYSLSGREGMEPEALEVDPGLKCFLEDLSETGCAVIVGGKAIPGLRVKVQFALDNVPVCMSGTVRSVEYKGPELNQSLLHIEADPLPLEVRNRILGEVFGMLPEDDEEISFQILDEEAESLVNPSNSQDTAV